MLANGWLTSKQAGRKLGVTSSYIRLLLRQGKLKHETTPFGRLIDPAALEQFAAQRAARQKRAAGACSTAPGSKVDRLAEGRPK